MKGGKGISSCRSSQCACSYAAYGFFSLRAWQQGSALLLTRIAQRSERDGWALSTTDAVCFIPRWRENSKTMFTMLNNKTANTEELRKGRPALRSVLLSSPTGRRNSASLRCRRRFAALRSTPLCSA